VTSCNDHLLGVLVGTVLALVWLVSVAGAAPTVAYVRGPDGQWVKLPASEEGGRVTVVLRPERIGTGTVNLIVNKPGWMVLDDAEPPMVAWLKVNGNEIRVSGECDLGVVGQFPLTLGVGLKDNANPLNAQTVQVSLPSSAPGPRLDVSGLGPPKPNGRVSVEIPRLPPGDYNVEVTVADLSPQANATTVRFRFKVIGFDVSQDQQTVRVGTPGGEFTFRAQRVRELQVGTASPAYLSTGIAGHFLYIDTIERVEVLQDTPTVKSVRLHVLPGKTDKDDDGTKFARLQYDLTIRDGLPALLVTSHTINVGPKQDVYTWWGWLPGTKWWDAAGEHVWSGQYKDVGKIGWVFLPQDNAETPGIGWISPHVFGESRFNTMLLYTDPRTIPTDTNQSVDMNFAIMSAKTAAEVAAVAEKIKTLALW
jgi:hypothetical protein